MNHYEHSEASDLQFTVQSYNCILSLKFCFHQWFLLAVRRNM